MKKLYLILSLLCMGTVVTAQDNHNQNQKHATGHYNHIHPSDSTDVFYKHLSYLRKRAQADYINKHHRCHCQAARHITDYHR